MNVFSMIAYMLFLTNMKPSSVERLPIYNVSPRQEIIRLERIYKQSPIQRDHYDIYYVNDQEAYVFLHCKEQKPIILYGASRIQVTAVKDNIRLRQNSNMYFIVENDMFETNPGSVIVYCRKPTMINLKFIEASFFDNFVLNNQ